VTPPLAPWGVRFSQATLGGVSGEWAEPKKGAAGFGALLYLHGGGYAGMSARSHRGIAGGFALRGFRVFTPDYRLTPEHIFPAALDDVAAVWGALRAQVEGPIFVAGDSSGGGLAVALMLNLRDQREQGPSAACLFSPWTDFAVTGASVIVNRDRDPMQVPDCLRMLAKAYLGDADPRSPLVSPLYGDLTGLPPLSIFVGADEILLDDSRRLAERARAAGGVVDLRIYPDMPHAWPLLHAILPEGRQALDEATAFMQATALRAVKIDAPPSRRMAEDAMAFEGDPRKFA
jgi:monoterpene epsilon-lactone hydrolase